METRSSNALFKRAEQLKRWEESDTNKEPTDLRKDKSRRVKFSNGCVFLAACASGDKEEVERLLEQGADINTANVDGLTALHQACIDDNLEMVEFLVEQGCDINRGDNEGWTPLHATASCGFISIAKFLIENGANVAAVNNDGELPIDIAESEDMEELLQAEIDKQGIDCDAARTEEERIMLEDAKQWVNSRRIQEKVHPKTGATALHVAAAKGYVKVISLLIQGGADINAQDNDGWTPLHAAAHWGQREACEMLAENLANMEIKNFAGQSCFDVAEPELVKLLEELKKKQATLQKEKPEITAILQKKSGQPLKRRTSVTRMSGADKSNVVMKDTSQERAQIEAKLRLAETIKEEKERKVFSGSETEESETEDAHHKEALEVARKNQANRADSLREKEIIPGKIEKAETQETKNVAEPVKQVSAALPQVGLNETMETDVAPWRRGVKLPAPAANEAMPPAQPSKETTTVKPLKKVPEQEEIQEKKTIENTPVAEKVNGPTTETKDKKRSRGSNPTVHIPPPVDPPVSTGTTPSTTPSTTPNSSAPTSPVSSSVPLSLTRRSFVPPVRDEESETQRKAHAKRVRETRRSTQGVTLEDVKSAEQQLLKKQQEESPKKEANKDKADVVKKENAITVPQPSVTAAAKDTVNQERRASWRARMEEGTKDERPSHRKAQDRSADVVDISATRLRDNADVSNASVSAKGEAAENEEGDKEDDKDKEGDNKTGTQAAIQRRKRPKRRSTGVVHMEGDEIAEEENAAQENETNTEKQGNEENKGTSDRLRSRFGSTSSLQDNRSDTSSRYSLSRPSSAYSSTTSLNEDTEKDLRKLYQEIKDENEKLKEKVSKMEEELYDTKRQLEKAVQNNLRNSLSDTEKRERRAMERKMSEMEEELKNLAKLKAENEKLRSENRALTRVISKISNK